MRRAAASRRALPGGDHRLRQPRDTRLTVIATSAIVAVLFDEPEQAPFSEAIESDPRRLISAATVLECGLVVETRYGEPGGRELDLLLHRGRIATVAVDEDQIELARGAWRRFGRGRHPASLNYGDCFAYALAAASGEPLLFKGEDFARTDIASALD